MTLETEARARQWLHLSVTRGKKGLTHDNEGVGISDSHGCCNDSSISGICVFAFPLIWCSLFSCFFMAHEMARLQMESSLSRLTLSHSTKMSTSHSFISMIPVQINTHLRPIIYFPMSIPWKGFSKLFWLFLS